MRVGSARMLSMASGVMPEATPLQTVHAAAAGGFDAVGLWVEPATWTAQTTREVRAALRWHGLEALDAEVVWLRPGPADPGHLRILDIAAEIGAHNVLVVSSDPDRAATAAKFAVLCEHAQAMPLRVALEFGAFSEVVAIEDAAAILAAVGHPRQAMLVDPLHLRRSGGDPAGLARYPASWFHYAQLCDAPAHGPAPGERAAIRTEAVDARLLPGAGALPLAAFLDALPPLLPLSVELRSRALREAWPDFDERAGVLSRATRAWLAGIEAGKAGEAA